MWEVARNTDNNYVKYELLVLNNNIPANISWSSSVQRDAIKVKFQSACLTNQAVQNNSNFSVPLSPELVSQGYP